MTTAFYDRMQGTATRLLTKFAQGQITLTRPGASTPGENPWDPPVTSDPVTYTLAATVKGVSTQFINGTTVLASDLEMTAAVVGKDASGTAVDLVPNFATDVLSIDGHAVTLVRDLTVPAAGVRVALKFIVRA
ncbi:MAG: hypothetical protein ABI216_15725 [Devosia sp.]